MAYYINLFSPETFERFANSDRSVSGFRNKQETVARRIHPGDKLICYVTKLSRWIGVLEVTSEYYKDDSPIFTDDNDPFTVRFKVKHVGSQKKIQSLFTKSISGKVYHLPEIYLQVRTLGQVRSEEV